MNTRFAVLAMPRSRTCWLSTFLRLAGVPTLHDPVMTGEAIRACMPEHWVGGVTDTGRYLVDPMIWQGILGPDVRTAAISRDRDECRRSFVRAMGHGLDGSLMARGFDEAITTCGFVLDYNAMNDPDSMALMFEYLVGGHLDFPRDLFMDFRWTRVERDAGWMRGIVKELTEAG